MGRIWTFSDNMVASHHVYIYTDNILPDFSLSLGKGT